MPEGDLPRLHVPTTSVNLSGPSGAWDEYFGDAEEAQYMIGDIRERHLAVLLMDGEEYAWLKRMTSGTQCPFWDINAGQCKDPLNVDAACYNTRYLGGYEMPLVIKIALPSTDRANVSEEGGQLKTQPMRSWTIWTPKVSDRDMVVRMTTGERFELVSVQETGPWRGLIVCQFFDLRSLQAGIDFGASVPVPLMPPR